MAAILSSKTVIKKSRNGRNISYQTLGSGSTGMSNPSGGGGDGGTDLLPLENTWLAHNTFNEGLTAVDEGNSSNWWYAYKHSQAIKGFVDRSNINVIFDKVTGLLTLSAKSGTFVVYVSDTVMYEKTTDSINIPLDTGIHFVYYETSGNLVSLMGLNLSQLYEMMQYVVPIGTFIYDQPSGNFVYTGYSLKGLGSSGMWVKNFFDAGIKRFTNLDVTNLTYGSGNADADARFGLSAGETILADIKFTVPTRTPTATWNIVYEDGSSPKIYEAAMFPMLTDINLGIGTTGRVVKNNQSNIPSAVTSGKYVWYFCAINNSLFDTNRTNMFMGSDEYTNENEARNNLNVEVGYCEQSIRIKQGITIVYAVLIQTKDSFTNAVKARIVSIDTVQNDSLFSSPVPIIPNELLDGSDASTLHHHDSLYKDWIKESLNIRYSDGRVFIGDSISANGNLVVNSIAMTKVVANFIHETQLINVNGSNYSDAVIIDNSLSQGVNSGVSDGGSRVALRVIAANAVDEFAGTLANQFGLFLVFGNDSLMAGGTITNSYGLYLAAQKAGLTAITNLYSIYSEHTDAKMFHSGAVGIGVNPTAHKLQIQCPAGNNNALGIYNNQAEKMLVLTTLSNNAVLELYQDNNGLKTVIGTADNSYFMGRVAFGKTAAAVEKVEVSGYVLATGFKIPSGTSSQYLKANGTVSTTAFAATTPVLNVLELVSDVDRFKVTANADLTITIPEHINGRDMKVLLGVTTSLDITLPLDALSIGNFTGLLAGAYLIEINDYGEGFIFRIDKLN